MSVLGNTRTPFQVRWHHVWTGPVATELVRIAQRNFSGEDASQLDSQKTTHRINLNTLPELAVYQPAVCCQHVKSY